MHLESNYVCEALKLLTNFCTKITIVRVSLINYTLSPDISRLPYALK